MEFRLKTALYIYSQLSRQSHARPGVRRAAARCPCVQIGHERQTYLRNA
jgi:hypothetical protein